MIRSIAVLLFALPVAVAAFLDALMPEASRERVQRTPALSPLEVNASDELEAFFAGLGYGWPPAEDGSVPPIAVTALPADFDRLPVRQRKALFFRTLAPLVAAENRRIREQRALLLQAFSGSAALEGEERTRIERIASHYNVAGDVNDPGVRRKLLRRVDVIPAALVLAQAANESGWGTSRFAKEANNLFGMWTWDRSRGIEPRERAANASHYVRVFDNLQEAVANYLHTINVGAAYGELRSLRAKAREQGEPLSPWILAGGLSSYSARGEAYVREIRSIIRANALDQLPTLVLQATDPDEAVAP